MTVTLHVATFNALLSNNMNTADDYIPTQVQQLSAFV